METVLMVENGERITKVTLNIRNQLLKDSKHYAIDNDTTFTDVVNDALEEYLQKRKRGTRKIQ